MLLELPKGPVMIDGHEVVRDFRINIVNGQARIKFKAVKGSNEIVPLDIVCLSCHTEVKCIGVAVLMNGFENITKQKFDLELYYGLRKRSWKVSGTFGNKKVQSDCGSFADICNLFGDLV